MIGPGDWDRQQLPLGLLLIAFMAKRIPVSVNKRVKQECNFGSDSIKTEVRVIGNKRRTVS
jgi:hypothetical protein